jgi:hypothetical protein
MDRMIQRLLPLITFVAVLTITAGTVRAQASPLPSRDLTVCHNTRFALCAASTCVDTGDMITGNDGIAHEASSCICPVLTGDNIMDLEGGNIVQPGSCEPPNPTVNVYSTFQFSAIIPQKTGPFWNPLAVAKPLKCPASDAFSQCWNWNCTILSKEEALRMGAIGITLARCTCPIEQTNYDFITQAGQGDTSACSKLPVGAPLFFDPEEVLGPANAS